MEENNTENIIKNIDKIKMLSGMLGQDGSMDTGKMENIINAITTAKKLGIINMPQEESHDQRLPPSHSFFSGHAKVTKIIDRTSMHPEENGAVADRFA